MDTVDEAVMCVSSRLSGQNHDHSATAARNGGGSVSQSAHTISPTWSVLSSYSEVTHRGVWGTGKLASVMGWKHGITATYAAPGDTLTAGMINAEREHITICMWWVWRAADAPWTSPGTMSP